jgi:hypothetical protein
MSHFNKILLIGHCGPDAWMLRQVAGSAAPKTPIVTVDSETDLKREMSADSLLLVNRILDGDFAAADGIELIRSVMKGPTPPKTMLISNYEDAQAKAVAAGALMGFGKSRARQDGVKAIGALVTAESSREK